MKKTRKTIVRNKAKMERKGQKRKKKMMRENGTVDATFVIRAATSFVARHVHTWCI